MAAENSRRKLLLDEKVEVRSLEDGFLGSWHSGTVIGFEDSSRSVQYDHLLNDESSRNLIENVKVSPTIDGVLTSENELFDNYRGLIRPIPSSDLLKPWCLHYGQCVDLFYDEAWWEGVIFDHEDGCEHRRIFFPDLGDEMDGPIEKLRLSKDWDELTEKWKPRGNWLFLELIEEAEQNWPLPVSVKQIWYEVRMKKGFEKLKEWTSSGRDIWRELVFQVLLDNFRITIKQLFMELDSSWHFEELGQSFLEFSESAIDFVLKTEELFRSSLAMVPFESTTIKMDTEEENLPIDLKNDDRVQEIQTPVSNHALPILSHNHNEDSGIGSDNYDDTPGTSSRSTRKPRLKWRSVVPELVTGAEFCPEAIDDFNEILRSKKKPSANVNLNVRKHLLHLGWKIDFLPDSRISRLRYFSPDGKVFYSLRLVCEEFVNLCQDSAPGSEMVMSSNYGRKVSHEETVFSPQSCDDDGVIEPEYCPEAVWDYYSVEKKDKEKKLKALKAKKHLSSIGWSFYYQMRGERKEIRYSSPTGTVYYSLIQACKWCIENNALTSSDPSCKAVKDFDDHLSTNKSPPPLLAIENLPNEPSEVETSEKIRISRKRGRKPRASKVNENNNIDADYSPPLRRSKRAREMIASSSQQTPKTMLSWLIDNNVVLPRAKVQYRGKNNGLVMKEGRIAREGIKCSCCEEIFTVSKFETHAGSTIRRPSANIFLADGRSLMQCQQELRKTKVKKSLRSDSCEIKGKRRKRKNDYICSVCHYGGDLVLCDQCPSSFHTHCLGLKDIPDGDWFCPSCCCKICGDNRINEIMAQATDFSFRICAQCEHRYHVQCLKGHRRDSYPAEGDWFCQDACEQIFFGLHKILGRPFPVGIENLTWTLVKYIKSDSSDQNASDDECLMENYSKLDVALSVMHECFEPVKEPGTKRDLVEDVIFSRRSELNRLNFQGFYTVLLEKNDELISAATVRIYGKKVAEVPLVATRFQYRRLGMCRVLMNELEKKLIELGVERLVLPAVPSVLHTWTTSFGFSVMNETERLKFLDYTFLDFQGTVICQKVLTNNPSAVSSLSTVSPVSCENGKKSANIELDGNSTVSEVFQADQVEEIDMVEQGSMCIATNMDSENGNCPAQLAVLVVDQSSSLPNCLPFKTKISLECHPVEVAEDKPAEDNSEGLLKCYKRRKISAC